MGKSDGFRPLRRSLCFTACREDHPDEFYELHLGKIFIEIYQLVEDGFCTGSKNYVTKASLWTHDYSEHLIRFVEEVGHPDPNTGKWGRLFREPTERSNLLQGILWKIIDAQVLSSLLFGAHPEHHKVLEMEDVALLNVEGFQRSSLRAHTNRTYLETSRGEPPEFWKETDYTTAQILTLLMPVYKYVAGYTDGKPPPFDTVHQWVHNLVAYAGWLNVCIRQSPAIVASDWVRPGHRLTLGQVNLSQKVYELSERVALKKASRAKQRQLVSGGPTQEQHQEDQKQRRHPLHTKSAARVKISVVPEIVRLRAATDGSGTAGTVSYTMMRPHVIYYHGRGDDDDEERRFESLPEYIRRVRDLSCTPRVVPLLIMFLFLWVLSAPSGQAITQ